MNANPPAGSFQGELGVVGLFDLGQLLMLNRATGCLVVHKGDRRGFLYFVDGKLVNAVDDANAQGETAAYVIFTWRSGAFQFRPEPFSGNALIQPGTEAVMLEAARRMDEAGAGAGGAESGLAIKLNQRQEALEALRDVFHQVTTEAAAPADSGAVPEPSVHLYALEEAGDRLVYRPGRPPRLRRKGEWREAAEPPMSPAAYGTMRTWLIERCRPIPQDAIVPSPGDAAAQAPGEGERRRDRRTMRRALELADGRVLALDVVNRGADETLWLRPVGLPAPDSSRLRGSIERLDQVLGIAHGLVMVGGPDLDSARALLNACVALLLAQCPESLLLVSSDWTYEHREPAGALLKSVPERARRSLRLIQPDILALDPGVGPEHVNLADLEYVSRVVAGVVVPDPAALVPRWLMRVSHGNLERAGASLATTPIGLVMAYPGALDDGTLAFSAWMLSERERSLALSGQTGSLSPILHQGTARARPGPRRRVA